MFPDMITKHIFMVVIVSYLQAGGVRGIY